MFKLTDAKFTIFPRLFPKQIFFFQQPQSYQISDRLKPRQTQEPSFIRDALKWYGTHSEMQITEITIALLILCLNVSLPQMKLNKI